VHLQVVGAFVTATLGRGCVEDQPQQLAVHEKYDLDRSI
jgi:hypothetical protein